MVQLKQIFSPSYFDRDGEKWSRFFRNPSMQEEEDFVTEFIIFGKKSSLL
jgi:hypothetical protein